MDGSEDVQAGQQHTQQQLVAATAAIPTVVVQQAPVRLTLRHESPPLQQQQHGEAGAFASQPQMQSHSHSPPQHQGQHHTSGSGGSNGELRVVVDSKERLRWSPQLHQRFCQAVDELGGCAFAKVGG